MKNLPLMLIVLFMMVGCKEDGATPAEPTADKMIARTWQVQSVQLNGQDDTVTDFSNYRFTFRSDQTYRFEMPDERQGRWELAANATLLQLDPGTSQEESVVVLELSNTNLLLEFTEQSVKLGSTQIRFTLVP